jgi:sulfate adenylyltransferase subunit 2
MPSAHPGHSAPPGPAGWRAETQLLPTTEQGAPARQGGARGCSGDYLDDLESHAIFVIREVAAECRRPAILFSGGKDSAVVLRLAEKAFHPHAIPFSILHVDTGRNFPETIRFIDEVVAARGLDLRVALVEELADRSADGPVPSRNRLQSPALLGAIRAHGFDACLGGARRDEDKARAKERIISLRDARGRWDPSRQRAELWDLYSFRVSAGEHLRVFPISDWTELDVWHYIRREEIRLPSIYFAHPRRVVRRDGMLLAVSAWVEPRPGEAAESLWVRFRTVGDATTTGAVESRAASVDQVIQELSLASVSERGATRGDDRFSDAAMEDRKREGYF